MAQTLLACLADSSSAGNRPGRRPPFCRSWRPGHLPHQFWDSVFERACKRSDARSVSHCWIKDYEFRSPYFNTMTISWRESHGVADVRGLEHPGSSAVCQPFSPLLHEVVSMASLLDCRCERRRSGRRSNLPAACSCRSRCTARWIPSKLLLNLDSFWTDLASNADYMSPGARPGACQACTSDLRLNSRNACSWWEERGFGGTRQGTISDQIYVAAPTRPPPL